MFCFYISTSESVLQVIFNSFIGPKNRVQESHFLLTSAITSFMLSIALQDSQNVNALTRRNVFVKCCNWRTELIK